MLERIKKNNHQLGYVYMENLSKEKKNSFFVNIQKSVGESTKKQIFSLR